jgi:hypothetical protein
VTVSLAILIIFFASVGLFRVVLHLKSVDSALEALTGGVGVITDKTSTVPSVVDSVNANLKPARDFAGDLICCLLLDGQSASGSGVSSCWPLWPSSCRS